MAPVALLVGNATLDRVAGELLPGGAVYYAAGALAAMGATVRVVTRVGPEFPAAAFCPPPPTSTPTGPFALSGAPPEGPFALSGAPPEGPFTLSGAPPEAARSRRAPSPTPSPRAIDALLLPAPVTTQFENRYGPDGRRTQRVLAAAGPLAPDDVPAAWRDADLVLLAPVLGEVAPAPFAAIVRARTVGLCVQGLVREVRADGAVAPRRWEPGPADLAGVGVAVLGDDEARGQADLVGRLAAALPLVVATHGALGCDVLERGRPARRVGVYPAREVDPTGAGDVFAAALLLALAGGAAPVEAARLGAAAASVAVEGRAGDALSRAHEAFDRARQVPVK
jgi:sugar/nucleoside kinase (ribokinase family)